MDKKDETPGSAGNVGDLANATMVHLYTTASCPACDSTPPPKPPRCDTSVAWDDHGGVEYGYGGRDGADGYVSGGAGVRYSVAHDGALCDDPLPSDKVLAGPGEFEGYYMGHEFTYAYVVLPAETDDNG